MTPQNPICYHQKIKWKRKYASNRDKEGNMLKKEEKIINRFVESQSIWKPWIRKREPTAY